MKDSFNFFAGYLLLINFVTLLVYAIDKIKARLKYWRISEKVLFLLALFGGSFGAILAMYIFHHKTKKTLFKIGIPIILIIHIILILKFYK